MLQRSFAPRGYLALYSDDARLYGYHGVEPGRSGIRAFYENFWASFPDSSVTLEHIIESGDEVVARFTLTATHQGALMGIPATGLAVTLTGITILRFRDGEVTERWSQADFFGLMQQISPGGAT
ncbi:MAG: ester cyclase [Bryobacteraceae bacterium]|nr:ester cyclase [Bryobacteraceae bacterium]